MHRWTQYDGIGISTRLAAADILQGLYLNRRRSGAAELVLRQGHASRVFGVTIVTRRYVLTSLQSTCTLIEICGHMDDMDPGASHQIFLGMQQIGIMRYSPLNMWSPQKHQSSVMQAGCQIRRSGGYKTIVCLFPCFFPLPSSSKRLFPADQKTKHRETAPEIERIDVVDEDCGSFIRSLVAASSTTLLATSVASTARVAAALLSSAVVAAATTGAPVSATAAARLVA